MEIKYNITRKDIWNFNKLAFIYIPIVRYFLIIMAVVILYPTVSAFLNNVAEGIANLIFLFIVLTVAYQILKWLIILLPSAKGGILGDHMMELRTDGVREQTNVNDNMYKWSGIYKIINHKKYIFIFTNRMAAHIIPRRSFATKSQADTFLEMALDLWKNNKQ